MPDYDDLSFTPAQRAASIALFALLDLAVSLLFFNTPAAALFLAPAYLLFAREQTKARRSARVKKLEAQFASAIGLVSTSLQAGYSVENAFREAGRELTKMYEPGAMIVREFRYIDRQLRLNATLEQLLMDMGRRSGSESVRDFAEVFYTAKRTGGDLIAIIRNTAAGIGQRQETLLEIETTLSGKVMEQRIMSLIPLLILAYVRFSSPGFMDPMYRGAAGRLVMSACLVLWVLAFLWGRKITDIRM